MRDKIFKNICRDYFNDGNHISLIDKIEDLEQRVLKLEDENISLTNELYRLENSLDSRIDILFEKLGVNYEHFDG
jgi:hypothetical protein